MTLDDFIAKYLGKKIDWDGYYGGQCVDLFRQYVDEVLDFPQPRGVSGAKDFWTNFESDLSLFNYYTKVVNTANGVPEEGSVVVWGAKAGGGYGHVAIFIEGDMGGFTSFDENWPTLNVCTKTKHDYTNVLGWFIPKPKTDPVLELEKKIEDLEEEIIDMRLSRDKWKADFKDLEKKYAEEVKAKNEHIDLMQKTMAEQNMQISSMNETISSLTSENKRLLDDSTASQKEFVDMKASFEDVTVALTARNTSLVKSTSDLEVEVSDLKKKLKSGIKGYTNWELVKEIFGR